MSNSININLKQQKIQLRRRNLNVKAEEAASHMYSVKKTTAEVERVYKSFCINPLNIRELERLLFILTNKERGDLKYRLETRGQSKQLIWNERVAAIARSYCWDMTARNFFSHYNPEGLTIAERLTKARVEWSIVGENIAVGDDVAAAHIGFMEEPPFKENHRSNILDNRFTHCGIGVIRPADGLFFISEIFFKPKDFRN